MLERSSYTFTWMTNVVRHSMVTKLLIPGIIMSLIGQGLSLCISEEVACERKGRKPRKKRLFREVDQT